MIQKLLSILDDAITISKPLNLGIYKNIGSTITSLMVNLYGDVGSLKLKAGEIAGCKTPDGVRILIIGTRLNNLIIFQEWTSPAQTDEMSEIIVYKPIKIADMFGQLLGARALNESELYFLIGKHDIRPGFEIPNIGIRLENMARYFHEAHFQKLLEEAA